MVKRPRVLQEIYRDNARRLLYPGPAAGSGPLAAAAGPRGGRELAEMQAPPR